MECLSDARNELKYLEDINKILLIQTSCVLKPFHNCGLELEQDKKPTLHRVLFWEAKLKLAFCENEKDREIGRKAIETKLSKRISIFHEVAAQLDPRVREIEVQGEENKVYEKISGIYDRITKDQSGIETCQLLEHDNADEGVNLNLFSLIIIRSFVISLFKFTFTMKVAYEMLL